jgi:hypothetical protein
VVNNFRIQQMPFSSLLPGSQQLAHGLCFSQQQPEVLRQQVDGGRQLVEHVGPVIQLIGMEIPPLSK